MMSTNLSKKLWLVGWLVGCDFWGIPFSNLLSCTLPETNSKFAPENGWLEDEFQPFLLGLIRPIFHEVPPEK